MINPNMLNSSYFPTWCPGCGDYGIWAALKAALLNYDWPLERIVMVYGVGCSGNMANTMKLYGYHGLHGRGIPAAEGIKLANHKLKIIWVGGDGDLLGEGMNHFITACRGNHDITAILHNNQVYGLTTGQSAPTSLKGTTSKSMPLGVVDEPINPIQLALLMGATQAIRGFAGDIPNLTKLITKALDHKGFSLVDVLQPCVTFNKLNTYEWFRSRMQNLEKPLTNRLSAISSAVWTDEKILIGEFFKEDKECFHEKWPQIKNGTLLQNLPESNDLTPLLNELR